MQHGDVHVRDPPALLPDELEPSSASAFWLSSMGKRYDFGETCVNLLESLKVNFNSTYVAMQHG